MKVRPLPRASGSFQWSKCSGSLLLQWQYPEPPDYDNHSANEGTATHKMGEQLIIAWMNQQPLNFQDFDGKKAPNGILFTEEMWDGANEYTNYVISFVEETMSRKSLHVEETIGLGYIFAGMFGTPDCWCYDSSTNTLHVFDLKFGRKFVDEYENPQLMIYGNGIVNTNQSTFGNAENHDLKIRMHIVQPRKYHERGYCRSWETTRPKLDVFTDELRIKAHEAMSENVKCVVGLHCHYCSARHVCKALHHTVNQCVDVVMSPEPLELHGAELASELTLLQHISEMVNFRLSSLEEHAMYELAAGEQLPGWKAEAKYGRLAWNAAEEEILSIGRLMGVDLSVLKLDTPTQVRNKLKKMKLDTDVINYYSVKPKAGMRLVVDDGSNLKRAFEK